MVCSNHVTVKYESNPLVEARETRHVDAEYEVDISCPASMQCSIGKSWNDSCGSHFIVKTKNRAQPNISMKKLRDAESTYDIDVFEGPCKPVQYSSSSSSCGSPNVASSGCNRPNLAQRCEDDIYGSSSACGKCGGFRPSSHCNGFRPSYNDCDRIVEVSSRCDPCDGRLYTSRDLGSARGSCSNPWGTFGSVAYK